MLLIVRVAKSYKKTTVRERDKVMRGIQNNDTARVLMDGFRNYYNFLRPHMGIDNNTSANEAGLNLELGRNKVKNLIRQSVQISSVINSNEAFL